MESPSTTLHAALMSWVSKGDERKAARLEELGVCNKMMKDLDIIVEAKMVVSVAVEQGQRVLHVEVLKLQHCTGIPPH